jgi:polar amino acid transport system ATP-binding protein
VAGSDTRRPDAASEAQRPPAVEFDAVTKQFGPARVLNGFTLSIRAGQTVTLIGPSGSGKTTVLRLAMALDRPTSGDIRVFGDSVVYEDPARKAHISKATAKRRTRPIGMCSSSTTCFHTCPCWPTSRSRRAPCSD